MTFDPSYAPKWELESEVRAQGLGRAEQEGELWDQARVGAPKSEFRRSHVQPSAPVSLF